MPDFLEGSDGPLHRVEKALLELLRVLLEGKDLLFTSEWSKKSDWSKKVNERMMELRDLLNEVLGDEP